VACFLAQQLLLHLLMPTLVSCSSGILFVLSGREDHAARGLRLFQNKEYEEAEIAFTKAIEKKPSDAVSYKLFTNRGNCRVLLEEFVIYCLKLMVY
jgi:tetratricopeptide (TPR) repeat protein